MNDGTEKNNWYPGQILDDVRYIEKRVDVFAIRARQAFFEWVPVDRGAIRRRLSFGPLLVVFRLDMRTYKDLNDGNVYAGRRSRAGRRRGAEGPGTPST